MANVRLFLIAALLCFGSAGAVSTSILQVSSSVSGVTPGKTGIISLSFNNLGSDIAYDTRVVFKSLDYPLTSGSVCNDCVEYSNSQRVCVNYKDYCYVHVGDIYGSNSQSVSFKVSVPSDIGSGNYVAEFEVYYGSKNITTGVVEDRVKTEIVVLSVDSINVKPDVNVESIVMPEVISPGDEFNVSVKLINSGEVDANNVDLKLITGDFKTKDSTNKIIVGDLSSNDSVIINYTLLADAAIMPGVYELGFNVSYSDDDSSYSSISNAGLLIDGLTSFNVFIQDLSPKIITKDSIVNALISIANTGVLNAKAVSIKLNPSDGITLGNVNQDFLGDLDTGDFTTTSFYFKPNREGRIKLNLTVNYLTASGKRASYDVNQDIVIGFGVDDKSVKEDSGSQVNTILIAFLVIVIVYLIIKNRKIKK